MFNKKYYYVYFKYLTKKESAQSYWFIVYFQRGVTKKDFLDGHDKIWRGAPFENNKPCIMACSDPASKKGEVSVFDTKRCFSIEFYQTTDELVGKRFPELIEDQHMPIKGQK